MAIPEHNKCVALHKHLRHDHQNGNWRRVRAIRRKNGKIKLKMRIRQMLKVELWMEKSRIREQYEVSYWAFNILTLGEHYRRWGKYDE